MTLLEKKERIEFITKQIAHAKAHKIELQRDLKAINIEINKIDNELKKMTKKNDSK
jgi:septal ring factor EnvC (AmiA/AmiB activator)